jgi:hypothetical protein
MKAKNNKNTCKLVIFGLLNKMKIIQALFHIKKEFWINHLECKNTVSCHFPEE